MRAQNGHTGTELTEKQGKNKAQRINNPVRPRLLTLKKAAEYIGFTGWGLRTLIWNGAILSVRYPGRAKSS